MKVERILVAIKPGEVQLPLSAERLSFLAERLDAELAFVSSVFDAPAALDIAGGGRLGQRAQARLLDRERARLEDLAGSLRNTHTRVTVRAVWHGRAYEGILSEVAAWRADLLIVGAHRPRTLPHTVLLDTDWQLLRLCPCPMLLVKNPERADYSSILAAIDPLHRHAEPLGLDRRVLDLARTLSLAYRADLRVAHSFPDPAQYAHASAIEAEAGVWYGAENIEHVHRKAVAELVSAYGVVPDHTHIRCGRPIDVIVDIVTEHAIDLVVMGAVKRTRLAQVLLGSTAEWVAAGIPCDVLAIKPP
jgi:universal stress protein E